MLRFTLTGAFLDNYLNQEHRNACLARLRNANRFVAGPRQPERARQPRRNNLSLSHRELLLRQLHTRSLVQHVYLLWFGLQLHRHPQLRQHHCRRFSSISGSAHSSAASTAPTAAPFNPPAVALSTALSTAAPPASDLPLHLC